MANSSNPFYVEPANPLQALMIMSNSVDDIQKQKKVSEQQQLMKQAGSLMQSGDQKGALALLIGGGNLQGAQAVGSLIQQQQAQQNSDRSYGLQERQVAASEKRNGTPAGFRATPDGNLAPIPGGPSDPAYKRTVTDKQNAPPGYKWADANNPEAGLTAIPGGPAEKITPEVAARIGLAKSFLGQLEDYKDPSGKVVPGIRTRIKSGEISGAIDGPVAAFNIGKGGELRRQIQSGSEALLRNLTGAGMNLDEARKYVQRYEPEWNDSADTLLSKTGQLERELRSVNDVVGQGRGGTNIGTQPVPQTGARPPGAAPRAAVAAPPAGAVAYLKANPTKAAEFEAKYGPGSAGAVLGQ